MMHKIYFTKGFSLVEMMVYLAIMLLLAGALITTFFSLGTVLERNATERALTRGAQVSFERISRIIRSADTVNLGLSTLGTSMGTLALNESATTTRFYISGGNLVIEVNGVEHGPLTCDSITVQNVVFNRYVGSTTEMVRVALTLSAVGRSSSSTQTFYSSAILRGSYE